MGAPLHWEVAGCRIAFSTAADGDLREDPRRLRWLERSGCPHPCTVPVQVHGTAVCDLDAGHPPEGCDGLVTAQPGRAIGVFGADCPGLVLVAPDAVAAGHCGWRGTAAGMVPALVAALARRSRHPPRHWHALVGPGISGRHYEVDTPVLSARPWPATALAPAGIPGRAHLDLPTAIAHDCTQAGVGRVLSTGVCTASDPRLHSYRHRGKGLVQLLAVWRG